MKAETQVGVGIAIFFVGWFMGQTVRLDGLPDWDYAAWATAAATVALVCVAIRALYTWRDQFILQRDHDMAMQLVQAVNDCAMLTAQLRQGGMLLDDPTKLEPEPPPEESEPAAMYFSYMLQRYRARRSRLAAAAVRRQGVNQLAFVAWRDIELSQLVNKLEHLEGELGTQVDLYVGSLSPDNTDPITYKQSIVFSQEDDPDKFKHAYMLAAVHVLAHLAPRLRLEKDGKPDPVDAALMATTGQH